MNCAEFERGLTGLLDGSCAGSERPGRLRSLREHARACASCRGSGDLLDWAELPAKERDPAEDPGEEYWQGFNARLQRRIESSTSSSPLRPGWILAAAALLLLLIAGPWLWMRRDPGPENVASAEPVAPPGVEAPPMPEELVQMLTEASGDEPFGALPWSAGPADGEDEAGLFPDAEGLDDDGRRELLEWLRARTQGV